MTSLYKTILGSSDLGSPVSCLVTNLCSAAQACQLIRARLLDAGDAFVILNGDAIADDILLQRDQASNSVRVSVAGAPACVVDLASAAAAVQGRFDPAHARTALVVLVFNRATPYLAVVSGFVAIAASLRVDNRNIHCVFLQSKKE